MDYIDSASSPDMFALYFFFLFTLSIQGAGPLLGTTALYQQWPYFQVNFIA